MSPERNKLLEQAIRLREEHGWSTARIAAWLEVSRGWIEWNFLQAGVDPPKHRRPSMSKPGAIETRGGHVVRRFTLREDEVLCKMEADGHSYAEIAKRLGRQPVSIRGRLLTLARREAREAGE